MKNVVGTLSMVSFCLSLFILPNAQAEESCDCPKLGCDPCSFEKGVTFFTGKCGPENSKVKSCARPTCIPLEEVTAACPVLPAANSGPREPVVLSRPSVPQESGVETAQVAAAGRIKVIAGSVSIVRGNGQRVVVKSDEDVRENDRIESAPDSSAVVTFEGGNKLHVLADTSVEVKEFKNPKIEESRKALLNLIKGKIRNQVEQKYNGKTSYYKVSTKGAVAGVRGTDFVIEHHEDDRMETKVETLGGHVLLASLDEKQAVEIARGEGAKFVADLPDPSFRDKDISDFIKRGSLTPVYKISDEKLKDLDRTSRAEFAKGKRPRVKDSAICEKPKGLLNQCFWRCVGNPAGESKCRTDLDNVYCVRQRCNGNGQWAEESRLTPAAAKTQCPASGELIKDCDY